MSVLNLFFNNSVLLLKFVLHWYLMVLIVNHVSVLNLFFNTSVLLL